MASQSIKQADKLTWIIDSGCTSHMAKNKSLFTHLDNSFRTKVKLGNGELVQAKGKGTVVVQSKQGIKCIPDVLYIPFLDQNLLSVAQMIKKDYSLYFKYLCCHIYDVNGCELVKVNMIDNSFPLVSTGVSQHVNSAKIDDSWMWHRKFGHYNMNSLRSMQNQDMVRDMPEISICNEQSGCVIKALRSDNGKEYTSNEFDKLCEEAGIKNQLSVPYSPQQNGVSERKNKTIVEMAKCMLKMKGLPKEFWAEAEYTAMYLLNRLPSRSVEGKTPIEAWLKTKPSTKHLRLFGFICYIHIPDAKRVKLDDKAELGIFLGYAATSKGYRIYNIKTKKVVIC
ncbi:uncharacterized protein LOC131175917 [Hevea brasiliensis]|uniref:uncharacterized protein LOC131175917 n=1 Tax=Hevea brasiliensis TaxID=3981 RepID=UPI0025FCD3B6|nr:uncharacterized protein LOC131175917 [Hevea brasiliensis]